MNQSSHIPEWAGICVRLLQGPIYKTGSDNAVWNTLTAWTGDISRYFSTIGLTVFVDQSDGYAFLKQADDESSDLPDSAGVSLPQQDDIQGSLPHLIRRHPLTPEVSLLCVLLREALDQFDTSQNQSSMLVLKESEIKERLAVFIREKTDQIKYYNKLDMYLNQLVNLTFLCELNNNTTSSAGDTPGAAVDREFEVRRIIRAKINVGFLTEFKRKLQELNGSGMQNAADGGQNTEKNPQEPADGE